MHMPVCVWVCGSVCVRVLQSQMNQLRQFVNQSRRASQTIFFGHYPTSTIGTAVGDIRRLFGSVHLTAELNSVLFCDGMSRYSVPENLTTG